MFKKMILFFMFNIFLFDLYSKGNISFKNKSDSYLSMHVFYKRNSKFVCNKIDYLDEGDSLVIGFMPEPFYNHNIFYKNIVFQVQKDSYKWGPFYLSDFKLDCDYEIYIQEENLWFKAYDEQGDFLEKSCSYKYDNRESSFLFYDSNYFNY